MDVWELVSNRLARTVRRPIVYNSNTKLSINLMGEEFKTPQGYGAPIMDWYDHL
jgi:hypothetical protein